ncbi:MAG: metallophosphoesterase [Bacteroidetes bacterium]|nr:metallophosphoesterase [Bacteroidota bacterium]
MVAVIGDIHGCFFTLVELYNKIRNKYPKVPIYSVGDLIDRGNFSYEVVKFFVEENIRFTPGNHDYMFFHFFKDPSSVFAKSWVFNGNESTLVSYEEHEDEIFKHIDFIKHAPLFYNLDDCFITHAGISSVYKNELPKNFRSDLNILDSFIKQDFKNEDGVLWTRANLLDLGKLQIVGHTKNQAVILDETANALYIDTGACVGNKLSAVVVHESKIIETFEQPTKLDDII